MTGSSWPGLKTTERKMCTHYYGSLTTPFKLFHLLQELNNAISSANQSHPWLGFRQTPNKTAIFPFLPRQIQVDASTQPYITILKDKSQSAYHPSVLLHLFQHIV
jgi:hypothetical protein